MEFVQFHPTGMVWPPSVQGHPRHRRRARRRRRPEEQRRPPLHVRRHPGQLQAADRARRGRRLALHAGRQERPASARAADARPRGALHHARGEGRPRHPARRRVPRHRLDQGEASRTRAEHIKRKLPSMYHQFKELADIDITQEPMEVGPTTHYIMGGIRVDGDTQMSTMPGLFAAGECAAGINGANRLGGNSLSDLHRVRQARRRVRRAVRAGRTAAPTIDDGAVESGDRGRRSSRSSAARQGENPYQVQYDAAGDDAGPRRHRARPRARCSEALDGLRRLQRARRTGRRQRPPRVQPRLAHRARSAQPADRVGSHHALGDRAQGEPRRPLPRRLSRTRTPEFGTFNIVVRRSADGGMEGDARRRFRHAADA